MSTLRVSTSFLDVGGDAEAERLDLSQGGQVYALEWLNEEKEAMIPQPRVQIVGTATVSAHVLPKSAIDQEADRILPVGTIIMWHGSETGIPWNWAICDGRRVTTSSGQQITTPDLRDTYLMGQDTADSLPRGTKRGADGGDDPRSHRVPVPLPRHAHKVQANLAGSASAYNPDALVRADSTSHTHNHVVAEKVVPDLKFNKTNRESTTAATFTSGGFLTPKYYGETVSSGNLNFHLSQPTDKTMSAFEFNGYHSSWVSCFDFGHSGTQRCTTLPVHQDPTGLLLRDSGRHTHAVDWKHEHNLSAVGADNPTTDVQPPYITLYHIVKVE